MQSSLYSGEESVLEKVLTVADEYLPEWRPRQSEPDIGTEIAFLFATMSKCIIQRM